MASAFAGAAVASQVREPVAVLPGPIAPDFSGFVAMSDPQAGAIAAALASGVEDGVLAKRDAEAITAFYASRADRPAWIVDGRFTPAALDVMARIERAGEDGLDPDDYRLPWKDVGRYFRPSADQVARFDLELSQAVVLYATQAYGGRVAPSSLSSNWGYKITTPDADAVLGLVSGSADPVATLAAYNPPQPEFAALRAELARLDAAESGDARPVVPEGALLKPGMSDARLPVIRVRLELPAATVDPELYDEATVAAVEAFQRGAGLRPDGIIGRNTLAAMNERDVGARDTILVNMERWRWMPRYLGDSYVRVNIPEFELDIYRDGEVAYTTRVVVGKVDSQTPIFSDEMEHIVVNPYWNVPASIVRNEMLPAIRKGSGLRGYQVFANVKGRYRAVDPRSVNWRKVDARKIQVRQPPGARNALGQVKFLFPNQYDVYLHDTPSKSLFERDVRAFSHGCVRVMNPWDFAEALLAGNDQFSGAQLKKRVGGGESWANLDHHIPVHITYFTAWVDGTGSLQVRRDIYGQDKRLAAALGLS